jgi:hypothetical protein
MDPVRDKAQNMIVVFFEGIDLGLIVARVIVVIAHS